MMKRLFIVVATVHIALAVKPPNYVEKPKVPDKYPPKYEYNYFVANRNNHAAQGHKEIRYGDNTAGNYFVNLPKGESKTTVNYVADEWGFFPITRYMSNGAHHRVSGHFALGQHAVERLNETGLNTNEILIAQKQQELARAVNDKQANTKLYPLPQAGVEQIQLLPASHHSIRQPIPLVYQHPQQIPLIYEYPQQQQPQVPMHMNYFYQAQKPHEVIYHQQPIISMAQLQHSTFLPRLEPAQPQQPTISAPQIEILPQEQQQQQQQQPNGNLLQVQVELKNTNTAATLNQEIAKIKDDQARAQEQFEAPIVVNDNANSPPPNGEPTVIVQQKSKVIESYQQPQKPQINVQILDQIDSKIASPNNNKQYLVEDRDQDLLGSSVQSHKEAPSRAFLRNFKKFHDQPTTTSAPPTRTTPCCRKANEEKTVAITQRPLPSSFLAPVHAGVALTKEKLDDCIDGHSGNNNNQLRTVVEVKKNINVIVTRRPPVFGDRIIIESTPAPPVVTFHQQQPVSVFTTRLPPTPVVTQPIFIEKSTAAPAVFTHPIVVEKEVEKIVDRPVFIKSPPETKIVQQQVSVEKPVIKEVKVPVEKIIDRPVYIKSPPEQKIVQQQVVVEKPVFIEKVVKQPVEKIVDRPVYIKSPPETKVVHHPVVVEKAVIKEVKVPVERTKIVHQPIIQTVEKPIFIEKIVKQPVEVEKIVEKIVDRPVERIVEKPVYHTIEKEKIVDRPVIHTVEKIVDRPVIQTVEKIVDRPVIQTVEKIVDRPVIQTVEKIVEKPLLQTVEKPVFIEKIVDRPVYVDRPYPVHVKPDFHVIAKAIPTKHKLFDFDALFRFLTKKEEVKHIYVPANPQHQLSQLNKHQLISSYSTIEPLKESPQLFDYTGYATSHLNPIKPVYGVPSASTTVLKPIAYSNPDPYAGNYNANQGINSVPQSWLVSTGSGVDSALAQSQTSVSVHKDNYVGPTPYWDDYWANNAVQTKDGIKFRRNVENGRSLRIEYGGFLPKMNPSVEIDENGKPIKKEGE